MRPRVSVLMCVYNGEDYVREAIDSILAQTFRDFELLVIDDASTDGTAAILASYGDPRLRVIRNETNRQHTASLNIGLRSALGEFVARHDADDRSHLSRLERQVHCLDTHPHVAVVGANYRRIDARGRPIPRFTTAPPCATAVGLRWQLVFGSPFPHSSVMFRRAVIVDELGGYDEHFLDIEDFDLWSRVARRYAISNLLEPLIDFRSHSASITAQPPSASKLELVREALRSNLIATLGEGDYEGWLDFWIAANSPTTHVTVASASKGMADLASLRARFDKCYPEAADEREVDRVTSGALGMLSYTLARHARLAALRTYFAALRADTTFGIQLLPRFSANVALGPLLTRRHRQ